MGQIHVQQGAEKNTIGNLPPMHVCSTYADTYFWYSSHCASVLTEGAMQFRSARLHPRQGKLCLIFLTAQVHVYIFMECIQMQRVQPHDDWICF